MHPIHGILARLCEFSDKQNMDAKNVFSSQTIFKTFQATLPISTNRALVALVRTLNGIDSSVRGFNVDGSILPFMQKTARKLRRTSQQHPIIPSRILYLKYKQYKECISDFSNNLKGLSCFIRAASEDQLYARHECSKYRTNIQPSLPSQNPQPIDRAPPIDFTTATKNHGLEKISKKYDWQNVSSVPAFLSLVQYCAKSLIHLFTLMRDQEALGLSVNCLEEVSDWNNEALYVIGISTKLESEAKPTKWITTNAIKLPIHTLSQINTIISPYTQNKEHNEKLFVSPTFIPISRFETKNKAIGGRYQFDHRLPPIYITEEDIQELESIDPLRNWRSDKRYSVGRPWKITSHQFRRSIAVFAGQSGLITLPSLKRLLQHLTKVMSTYYMKGCAAQNYLFSKINPALTLELRRAKEEADNAIFIRDALRTAEKLYGFGGRQAMDERANSVWLSGSQADTAKQVKLGLVSWQDSPLGGCGSPVPCDKRAHANYETCPGCKHLIGKESVMNETIAIMEFDLAELVAGTMEYKAEKQNIEDFKALRDKIIAKG
jgi:hypothetical protein